MALWTVNPFQSRHRKTFSKRGNTDEDGKTANETPLQTRSANVIMAACRFNYNINASLYYRVDGFSFKLKNIVGRKKETTKGLLLLTLERQPVSTPSIPGRPHTRRGSITNMPTADEAEREISDVSRRYRHSTCYLSF